MAAPKIGLKHPMAVSDISEFAEGTSFKPIISKTIGGNANEVQTVVLCSGKVAFDIEKRYEQNNQGKPVKFIRVEEIAPFPCNLIREETSMLGQNTKFVWVQEEPVNQGAFQFAKVHMDRLLADRGQEPMAFVGRKAIHTFATGVPKDHAAEGAKFMEDFDKATQ